MNKDSISSDKAHQKSDPKPREKLSPALMKMARRELRKFQAQSDEAFLIRAEIDRKLTSI